MPWNEIGLNAVGIALYPGVLAALVVGLAVEVGAAWALVPERGGPVAAVRGLLAGVRGAGSAGVPMLSALGLVLAAIAALQTGLPLNPVPPEDRNLLVAAVALVAAGWLAWGWGWGRGEVDAPLLLRIQLCWLVALLVPAVVPQTLHPGALGIRQLTGHVPVKFACGLLYMLCLPALLQLLPESAPLGVPGALHARGGGREAAGMEVLRAALWLPFCALFASLFFPPAQDALGVVRFVLAAAGAAALSVAGAKTLIYQGAAFTRRFYLFVVVPFAWVTVGLGMISAAVTPT
jgi:hypothetical protein